MPVIKISVRKEDVLEQGDGYILIKPRYYSEYAEVAYVASMKNANTAEEFHNDKNLCDRTGYLFIGQGGGITCHITRRS